MSTEQQGSPAEQTRAAGPEREQQLTAFLTANGQGDSERSVLAADASFRRYDRLKRGEERFVLMDAPPPLENVRPFLAIADRLLALGFSAPRILARDAESGFLLLEDLGDDTFTRLIERGEDEGALYRLATDLLLELHRKIAGPDALPGAGNPPMPGPYDKEAWLREARLLTEWYLPVTEGRPFGPDLAETDPEFDRLILELDPVMNGVPACLVLRDFHVDNLMVVHGRQGVQACGLLDFQDALTGPCSYDLASLIRDVRRDVPRALQTEMVEHYLAGRPELDRGAFRASLAAVSVQRNLKIVGIFTRLAWRDGKSSYLGHIARTWRLIEEDLEHPALSALKAWIDRRIPKQRRVTPAPPDR